MTYGKIKQIWVLCFDNNTVPQYSKTRNLLVRCLPFNNNGRDTGCVAKNVPLLAHRHLQTPLVQSYELELSVQQCVSNERGGREIKVSFKHSWPRRTLSPPATQTKLSTLNVRDDSKNRYPTHNIKRSCYWLVPIPSAPFFTNPISQPLDVTWMDQTDTPETF